MKTLITMLALLALTGLAAGTDGNSTYDKVWDKATLYHDESSIIQDVSFVGRAQFEYFNVDSDQGSKDDWEVRRLRAGLKVKAGKWLLHTEASFDADSPNPFYTKLTDAYVQYTASKALVISVGKQSVRFGLDGATSSTQLITIDRSNLANNLWFTEEYAPGVSVSGRQGQWVYSAGWFTSDGNPEFGDFAAGSFGLTSLGYDFSKPLRADKALLRLDYVRQQPDTGNIATRPFQDIGSVNFSFEKDKLGLGADVMAGNGYGSQGDVIGCQVMASYSPTKTVQAVVRYTHLSGDDNAIRLGRYENRVVAGKGDQYDEVYAGVNWYLYGHKLKWQTGLQYAKMGDSKNDGGEYSGWQMVSGIRISW